MELLMFLIIFYGQSLNMEPEWFQNLLNYINPQQYSPQEFTGGGGQGGQAARKLYYPGTWGGFTSVGRGIGGGNTLDELLKQLQRLEIKNSSILTYI